jgi:hypothetical protein
VRCCRLRSSALRRWPNTKFPRAWFFS